MGYLGINIPIIALSINGPNALIKWQRLEDYNKENNNNLHKIAFSIWPYRYIQSKKVEKYIVKIILKMNGQVYKIQ